VLVHGISTPSIMWEYTARGLVERGYRVLVYGSSNPPEPVQRRSPLLRLVGSRVLRCPRRQARHSTVHVPACAPPAARRLALRMHRRRLHGPPLPSLLTHVLIAAQGGAIAVAFATTFPQLTASVALLCPAGLMAAPDVPRATRLLTAPLLRPVFRTLTARKAGAVPDAALAAVVRAQAALLPAFPGVLAASFREGPVRGLESRFARLGELAREKKTRVLLIWVPFSLSPIWQVLTGCTGHRGPGRPVPLRPDSAGVHSGRAVCGDRGRAA
jgi:pimeloyl-ACP methyl ester carboxylesterase